jgi:hypothetical protein
MALHILVEGVVQRVHCVADKHSHDQTVNGNNTSHNHRNSTRLRRAVSSAESYVKKEAKSVCDFKTLQKHMTSFLYSSRINIAL